MAFAEIRRRPNPNKLTSENGGFRTMLPFLMDKEGHLRWGNLLYFGLAVAFTATLGPPAYDTVAQGLKTRPNADRYIQRYWDKSGTVVVTTR